MEGEGAPGAEDGGKGGRKGGAPAAGGKEGNAPGGGGPGYPKMMPYG